MTMRALLLGDVVGNPGRDILAKKLAPLRRKRGVDFCIANVENASGGSGLTIANAREILASGVDVMTMGDHVWKRKEIVPFMEREPRLLRPLNLSRSPPAPASDFTRCPAASRSPSWTCSAACS
jgi:hypothetical protein